VLLTVPADDVSEDVGLWPTLGPLVCRWIEDCLVHGPGDLRGQPVRLDEEKRFILYRAYEVWPRDHQLAGRRRFKRVVYSARKGTAKTELAAHISGAELAETAPVRTIDWTLERGEMVPVGGPVSDPYIPMVSVTEGQSEEQAYGALRVILGLSVEAGRLPLTLFDIGLERVMRARGDGVAQPLATSPNARDGARTTFQHFDETHRLYMPRVVKAHETMLGNIPKRFLADAWTLETTTAFSPGEGSIAESAMKYARQVREGGVKDQAFFYYHRQASPHHDIATPEGLRAAVIEASGPSAEWSDLNSIIQQFSDPTRDRAYLQRVWLNRLVRGSGHAFDAVLWGKLRRPVAYRPADRAAITLAFAGARYSDAAVLIGTEILTGFQWVEASWAAPVRTAEETAAAAAAGGKPFEVPEAEVSAAVARAFRRWTVWRLYAMPSHWETTVSAWAGEYDEEDQDRVVAWRTNQRERMARACRAYANSMAEGSLSHDGSELLAKHVGACCRRDLQMQADDSGSWWVIQKESPDSPAPINGAVAAIIGWQARLDAMELGVGADTDVYKERLARGEEDILRWV
jgi:hypothetical protein